MGRGISFDANRDMAQAHIDQLQQQLNDLTTRLTQRDQEIVALQDNNATIVQLQQQLNDSLIQEIAQFQIASPAEEIDNLQAQIANLSQRIKLYESAGQGSARPVIQINATDEYTRGRVPALIKRLPQFTGNPKQLSTWVQSVE